LWLCHEQGAPTGEGYGRMIDRFMKYSSWGAVVQVGYDLIGGHGIEKPSQRDHGTASASKSANACLEGVHPLVELDGEERAHVHLVCFDAVRCRVVAFD
jgi:hypothetical protein